MECLSEGCNSFASQSQLRRVLSPAEFEKYEDQLLEGALDLMSDVVKCPRLDCQAPVILEPEGESSSQQRLFIHLFFSHCALWISFLFSPFAIMLS